MTGRTRTNRWRVVVVQCTTRFRGRSTARFIPAARKWHERRSRGCRIHVGDDEERAFSERQRARLPWPRFESIDEPKSRSPRSRCRALDLSVRNTRYTRSRDLLFALVRRADAAARRRCAAICLDARVAASLFLPICRAQNDPFSLSLWLPLAQLSLLNRKTRTHSDAQAQFRPLNSDT